MKNNPRRFRARALATLTIAALGVTTLFSGASAEEVEPNGEQISSIRIENPNPGASSTSQQPVEAELDSAASAPIVPVYRFWSPVTGSHFYTTDKTERDTVIKRWPKEWKYEGKKFSAFSSKPTDGVAVHRFWSPVYKTHFYTADENEKNTVLKRWPTIWKYEKVAYYAYPGTIDPYSNNSTPVFRFWGQPSGSHFYTVDPKERGTVLRKWPTAWSYEGPRYYLPVPPGESTPHDEAKPAPMGSDALAYLNDARAAHGLEPLQYDARLDKVAGSQSWYMAVIDKLTDKNPSGDLQARMDASGFDWYYAGEELALIYDASPEVQPLIDLLLSASDGYSLILDPDVTHFGITASRNPNVGQAIYWSLVIAEAY